MRELRIIDEFELKSFFGKHFIEFRDIVWDVEEAQAPLKLEQISQVPEDILNSISSPTSNPKIQTPSVRSHVAESIISPTAKEALYISPPKYPRIDTDQIAFMEEADYGRASIMYTSLPVIPQCQNEISITTRPEMMLDSDFLRLFPNHVIQTRKPPLYERLPKVKFYDDIGIVLPISGFTDKQLLDNVIKYPHLHQLKRVVNNQLVPFHAHIEIDGELHPIDQVWDSLPISKIVPKKSEYVMEYVTRRYLLERDLRKIIHKYPMAGQLDPFLTLFAPPEFYQSYGYKDAVSLAKQCVNARIAYRKSRNGILQNSGVSRCIYAPYCVQPECKLVCPTYQQIDYLLSQNELSPPNPIYSLPADTYELADNLITKYTSGFHFIENNNPGEFAKLLTYCSICTHWRGSRFSMVVYHLKFAKYIERLRASWSQKDESDDLQYTRIWAESAKVLIISNLDFVSFGDFECQTLLQLIQDRADNGKLTFIVCKDHTKLVGRSSFFSVFTNTLKEARTK